MALQQPEILGLREAALGTSGQPLVPEAHGLIGKADDGPRVPTDTVVAKVAAALLAKNPGLNRDR